MLYIYKKLNYILGMLKTSVFYICYNQCFFPRCFINTLHAERYTVISFLGTLQVPGTVEAVFDMA